MDTSVPEEDCSTCWHSTWRRVLKLEGATDGDTLPFDADLLRFTRLTRLELTGPFENHLFYFYDEREGKGPLTASA
jgi:hypothetical protein